jgi:ATP-dependent Clp protease ATP-binding subunit ClpC
MDTEFTDAARHVMVVAERAAREMQHEYIGTEHLLLGLIEEGRDVAEDSDVVEDRVAQEGCGVVADVLRTLGTDASKVHREIERLVQRGPQPVAARTLPLTPRSKRSLEYAAAEAHLMDEQQVGPEHILLGLFRVPDGVAGQALRNLGLELKELVTETFKIRVMQMKAVERAVRPVRASTAWKRKTREELLAHLTTIYDEELSQRHDPVAAIEAAAGRFGKPAELSRELESALPPSERRGHLFERIFGWRAPESAARYMLRQAALSFAIMLVLCLLIAIEILSLVPGGQDRWRLVRTALAVVLITPAAQFLLGLSYYKQRDALYGPIWATKSKAKVVVYTLLVAIVTFCSGIGFIALNATDAPLLAQSLLPMGGIAAVTAVVVFTLAKRRGPTEIRDTFWASMQLDS